MSSAREMTPALESVDSSADSSSSSDSSNSIGPSGAQVSAASGASGTHSLTPSTMPPRSTVRRTAAAIVADDATAPDMSVRGERTAEILADVISHAPRAGAPDAVDDSDVFVCRRSGPESAPEAVAAAAACVTLFVYGWENVEPGPLSWVFPSLRSALDAVRTMRNAVEWCIASGDDWTSMDAARANGAVLIEQNS